MATGRVSVFKNKSLTQLKVTVVVIVYNRFENLKHWLYCWSLCDKTNAELVVIHNVDKPEPEYNSLVAENGGTYIERKNAGFDIGSLQDVFSSRLNGFPEWGRMLWMTDDTFPMQKDFISKFTALMTSGVGCVCMQVSSEVRLHIRTTGFMIDKSLAIKIRFPADPITTKDNCYDFEHRHPRLTFLNQIKAHAKRVIQVSDNEHSPLYDIGYWKRVKREDEHALIFGKPIPSQISQMARKMSDLPAMKPIVKLDQKVTFICPIYNSFPAIISSMIMQTNRNWELWLIHDGKPNDDKIKKYVEFLNDPRIKYEETEFRSAHWGHRWRSEYLQKVTTSHVVICNPDNSLAPVFIEYLLKGFKDDTVGCFSGGMVHSYLGWAHQDCWLERGHIDCNSMVLRTKEAQVVGWNNITDHSSDWWFFNDLIQFYGEKRFVKVKATLLFHN